MVREVSVNARDEQPQKHDHQSHYTRHKVIWIVSLNNTVDVPMRIFSQPSNIDSAKVDSKQIRHLQRKRRKEERGGVYTRDKSVEKRDAPLSSSFCFVVMDGVQGGFVRLRKRRARELARSGCSRSSAHAFKAPVLYQCDAGILFEGSSSLLSQPNASIEESEPAPSQPHLIFRIRCYRGKVRSGMVS